MGREKDRQIEKDDKWLELCRTKDWQCGFCGEFPQQRGEAPDSLPYVCPSCRDKLEEDDE